MFLEEPSSESNTDASSRSGMKHNTGFGEGQRHFFGALLDAGFPRFNPHPVLGLKRMIRQRENPILIHPQLRMTSCPRRDAIHTAVFVIHARMLFCRFGF
ncbi:hypothetical protein HYPDE_32483 [Hyphomicrobium denitrificans 1NES1]|uniref:Uncharacterized protein n=1 Tax=Hyphomicrobium denitrificans 1NES1 TaxID=670307 RepID=N0B3T0_9HYPH|nr:hypothetical protein HYPDE_32483 [Hyphomicrobium denitrificans 1NES1]